MKFFCTNFHEERKFYSRENVRRRRENVAFVTLLLPRSIQFIIPGHFSCILTCVRMCVLMHVKHKEKTRCMRTRSVMDQTSTEISAILFTSLRLAYFADNRRDVRIYLVILVCKRCIAKKIRSCKD